MVFIASFIFFIAPFCSAESILLKNGQKVEGLLWEKSDKYVKLVIDGVLTTFFSDEIDPSYFAKQEAPAFSKNQTFSTNQTVSSGKAPLTKPAVESAAKEEKMAPGKKSMILCKQGAELGAQGKFKEAEVLFKEAMALARIAPQGFDSFAVGGLRTCSDVSSGVISDEAARSIAQAAVLLTAKQVEQSLKLLEKVAKDYPDYAPIWHDLGLNYLAVGQVEKSLSSLEKSLRLESDNPDTLFALGAAQIALSQFVEAKANLEKAKALYLEQGRKPNSRYIDAWMKKMAEKAL